MDVRNHTTYHRARTGRGGACGVERQLQQSQKLESLGVLAGGIAHDFNNILTGMMGFTEMTLKKLPPTSPLRGNLDVVMKGGKRAADLCRQMLAYTGKSSFALERVDLRWLIEEMPHLLQSSISKKAILNLNLQPDLPPIQADPSQIRQVVMNLIINASESLGDQPGVITVSASARRCDESTLCQTYLANDLPPGLYVQLEVSDTGCGMDAETQARMFEPFYTTKFTGRGLGLAAVLGIVRAYKGALNVTSEPGQGTTFKVLLPALESVGDRDAAMEELRNEECGMSADVDDVQSAIRIPQFFGGVLFVDDEPLLRDLGRDALEDMGFTVLIAVDGRDAAEVYQARAAEIDLVLLDLTMPRMDGGEALAALRQLNPDVRVVLASGYSREEVAERFAGRGLAGVL